MIAVLVAVFVERIPDRLVEGTLYVNRRVGTAAHLCCCGCGSEVVTPLNSRGWQLTVSAGGPSLYPSIGNWSLPCRSHYFIQNGQVEWASSIPWKLIRRARRAERKAHATQYNQGFEVEAWWSRFRRWVQRIVGITSL